MLLDLKSSLRSLRRRPALTVTAIVTLTLGICAATATFSLVSAVLFRPLPYAHAERLVALWPQRDLANREIAAFRQRSRTLDEIASFSPGWLMALTGVAVPRELNAARVSGNMFQFAEVAPLLGRPFEIDAERPGNDAVVVLGYALWRSTFDGDSGIIGRSITLNGNSYRVVAVMPQGFQLFDWQSDLWYPLAMDPTEWSWSSATALVYGRLHAGATVAGASDEIRSLAGAVRTEFALNPDWTEGARVAPLLDDLVGGAKRMLWILFGGVVLLLLIATTNVANLLLVRAAERRQELGVRLALGASRARVARLLLTEALLLGAVGGLLGAGAAMAIVRLLPAWLPRDLPRLGELRVHPSMLAFAMVITIVPSLAAGLAPVWLLARRDLGGTLRESRGARGGERMRASLVVAQVGIALVLTAGATIMARSLGALQSVDVGLRPDHLLTAFVMPTGARDAEQVRAFWRDALGRIGALPGVTSASTILHLPTSGRSWTADIEVDGRPLAAGASPPRAGWQSVSAGFFATAGVRILQGRGFTNVDVATAPRVAVVNEPFAKLLFPHEDAVGKRIKAGHATETEWATIVGVVAGVRHGSLYDAPEPEIYVPFEQHFVWANSLVVRTAGDPAALAPAVRAAIWSVDRSTPVEGMRSMDAVLSASLARPRFVLLTLGVFAAVGLVLGAIGIYGVVAFGVEQRARELGIRAALGAGAGELVWLVVRGGLRYGIAGVGIGAALSIGLSGALRGLVFGVSATDPLSLGAGALVLLGVAIAASWIPARRAALAEPMQVLRSE